MANAKRRTNGKPAAGKPQGKTWPELAFAELVAQKYHSAQPGFQLNKRNEIVASDVENCKVVVNLSTKASQHIDQCDLRTVKQRQPGR